MIGESLEQHCSVEFNRLRPLFKNAYFEKDNDARTGSKGDFIFQLASKTEVSGKEYCLDDEVLSVNTLLKFSAITSVDTSEGLNSQNVKEISDILKRIMMLELDLREILYLEIMMMKVMKLFLLCLK